MRFYYAGGYQWTWITAIYWKVTSRLALVGEINRELADVKAVYGRGGRMKLKRQVTFTFGHCMVKQLADRQYVDCRNKLENWLLMSVEASSEKKTKIRRVSTSPGIWFSRGMKSTVILRNVFRTVLGYEKQRCVWDWWRLPKKNS